MYPSESDPRFGAAVASQVRAMQKSGIETNIWFIDGKSNTLNYLTAFFKALFLGWNVCRGYDFIHYHFGLTLVVAWPLMFYKRAAVTFHGSDLLRKNWIAKLGRWLSRKCQFIVVMSDEMASTYKTLPKQLHVIPMGVDMEIFKPLPKKECRQQLGLDQNKRYVLFANHPQRRPEKRYDVIEAAVKILESRLENVEILAVYDRPHGELPFFMNASDCIALASDYEGSPNVIREGMACNLPIVSVDVGDVRKQFAGANGYLLCERSPQDMADKLYEVLTMPGSIEGRQHAEKLSHGHIVSRLRRLYDTLS